MSLSSSNVPPSPAPGRAVPWISQPLSGSADAQHAQAASEGAPEGAPLTSSATSGLRWTMRRNCSLAPRQVLGAYLLVCMVSFLIASCFAWFGAVPVLYFAGIELSVLGVALLVYARHATDHETIILKNSTLAVEHHYGSKVERAEFRAEWLRIEPAEAQGSLLELSGAGKRTFVGRYVRPEWRQTLARELRQALRMQAGAGSVGPVCELK